MRALVRVTAEVCLAGLVAAGGRAEALELAERGLTLELTAQGDHSSTLWGGLRRGSAFRRPLGAALDVDAERLVGWRGARLHAGLQALDGRHATDELVGDAQGFDNIDAERLRQVSEAWLEQRLWGGRARVKLGKVDANSEFARVEHAGGFLNSSAGYSPTIQGFPTYPDPAASASVFLAPVPWLDLGAGLFDGSTQEGCHGRTGNRGVGTFWGQPSTHFLVGEAGARLSLRGRPGRLGVGVWTHSGTFGSRDGATVRGTRGFFATLDQALVRPREGARGLHLFAQLGTADGRLAEIERHVAVGLSVEAPLRRRPQDAAGLLVTAVRFGAALRPEARHETAIELFYGVRLRPWLTVKPDLQWLLNPGGMGNRDALVGTVRLVAAF